MNDPTHPGETARSTSPLPPLAPLQNPKYRHISRSAAKRESVQMLGSIKDLQLHFSRAGLVEHRTGSGVGVKGMGGIDEGGDEENVPPGPSRIKRERERRPWKEVELPKVEPAQARREARGTMARVRNLWGITGGSGSTSMSPSYSIVNFSSPISPGDSEGRRRAARGTGTVLVDTAKAIRRVRSLALGVNATGNRNRRVSGSALVVPKSKHRLGFSTPSRPSSGMPRAVSSPSAPSRLGQEVKDDGMGELRKAALDVLAGLRALEERLRLVEVPSKLPSPVRSLSPGVSSGSSVVETDSTRPTSTTSTEPETYDSDDGEYSFNTFAQDGQEETGHGQTWEERIVAEAREYRDLGEEDETVDGVREAVRRWIGVVEGLFNVREGDVGELEDWAREHWEGRPLDQLHSFLLAHLPPSTQILVSQPSADHFRQTFLARLADGFILTQAYNSAVLSSPKAWGFIPAEDIHDTLQSNMDQDDAESKAEKEWTFRKVGNLTCWAAAVRLRYNLPINMPTHTSTLTVPLVRPPPRSDSLSPGHTPSTSPVPDVRDRPPPPKRKETTPRYDFDPLKVAKREDGWAEMLEGLLLRWLEEAVREAREDVAAREASGESAS